MLRILALTFALLAVPTATALAQSATPVPGCHGVQVNDKAGDSMSTTPTEQPGSPSSDIIAGWIDYDPATNKATANVQVDNLTEGEVDAPYVAISWEFGFSTPAGARYVRAYQDVTGVVKYTWGEPRLITDDQTQPRAGGTTTGALFPGDDGVVQIEIPLADVGATPGSQLKAMAIEVRQWVSLPAAVPNTGLPVYSYAPPFDNASGRGAYTLGPCVAEPGPADPAPEPPVSAPAELDVKVTVPKLSARKLRRSKKVRIKLTGTASDLVATLRKGRRTVGTGRLAELDGSGRLTLKLRRKKLKKGRYVLAISGRNAEGQQAEGTLRVKVRR